MREQLGANNSLLLRHIPESIHDATISSLRIDKSFRSSFRGVRMIAVFINSGTERGGKQWPLGETCGPHT
jgi:hypothetical protein